MGDLWVLGTSGCGGHVGEGDMWVLGTSGGLIFWGTCVPDSKYNISIKIYDVL